MKAERFIEHMKTSMIIRDSCESFESSKNRTFTSSKLIHAGEYSFNTGIDISGSRKKQERHFSSISFLLGQNKSRNIYSESEIVY